MTNPTGMKRNLILLVTTITLTLGLQSALKAQPPRTANPPDPYAHWRTYRGTADARQYSSLRQIDTTNVHQLQPAWTYRTGDAGERTTIECNPIIIDGTMYVTSPQLDLIALEAATGEEQWRFHPSEDASGVNRGVTYWEEGNDQRILYGAGARLYALNAKDGQPVAAFGDNGRIDLRENLGADPASLSISLTTPGIVYNDLLIIGSSTGEGYNASPGHIRAYDVRRGQLVWIFHTLPQPGTFGHDTWQWQTGENYGGTNNWGGLSLDEARGVVYVATGSPTYDFYGANRLGENLFGNCVIALDAATGRRKWHYQVVHHDLWDYDLACAPTLMTIPHRGQAVDVLVQPTKMGTLVVLDRETGKPLTNNQETPVPASDVPGEQAHPTQPMQSDLVIVEQGLTEDRLTNISPEAQAYARQEFARYRNEGFFTPPSQRGTLAMPSTRGGFGWGGASYNPENQVLYATANEVALILKINPVEAVETKPPVRHAGGIAQTENQQGRSLYLTNCSSCHGARRQGVPNAFPALTGLRERLERPQVAQIITHGKGSMPAHPQFSEAQLDHLIDFLLDTTAVVSEPEPSTQTADRYVLDGFKLFLDQEGYPATRPPWGTLNAVDMTTFELLWKVPLGAYPELLARDVPPTGTQHFGGCVATAGGLVFAGGSADAKFRAFSASTGEVLWEAQLPAGGYATPAVYQVDGRQYVVIAAGGGNRNGTPSGDTYVAFALPEQGQ